MAKELLFLATVVILGLQSGVDGDNAAAQHHLNRRSNIGEDLLNRGRSMAEYVVGCGLNSCGAGARCIFSGTLSTCACLPGYSGDPLLGCEKTKCLANMDCNNDEACVNQYCVNLCESACGINADCFVHNHMPECSCPYGYSGDPMSACAALM